MIRILVTSGGFLGGHAAEALRGHGHEVLARGNARNLRETLAGVDVVLHLMDGETDYPMPDLLAAMTESGTGRLILESTLEVYGEGLHADATGSMVVPERRAAHMAGGHWQIMDDSGRALTPMATPETTAPAPTHARGIAALARETQARIWAEEQDRHICILRLASIFGPPLEGNPEPQDEIWRMMTEVLAGQPPQVAEDGGQIRDWLHVRDAARAMRLAVEHCDRGCGPMNITSGRGYTGDEVARLITSAAFRYDLEPQHSGLAEAGIARHLIGTQGLAQSNLGFTPELPLENALGEVVMAMRDTGKAGP